MIYQPSIITLCFDLYPPVTIHIHTPHFLLKKWGHVLIVVISPQLLFLCVCVNIFSCHYVFSSIFQLYWLLHCVAVCFKYYRRILWNKNVLKSLSHYLAA